MNLIACVDNNWGIGYKGRLLIDIPEDKRLFKELTLGKVVVGGRKTMESFPGGTTLENRTNMILTHKQDYSYYDAVIVHSVEEAIEELGYYDEEDIFVIGGEEIYRQFLPYCTKAYITKVDFTYSADAHMVNLDKDPEWEMTMDSDEYTYYDMCYEFTVYERVSK